MQFLSGICAAALAATFALSVSSPVNAAPVFVPKAQAVQSDVIQVQDGAKSLRSYGWHNGYRGYRHYRRGYREFDGFWFPAGAFIAGAVIGSAIANNNAFYGGGYHDYEDGYYGSRYYANRYYGDRYYGDRYDRPRYYGDRYYGQAYANGRPCSPRLDDAGKCRNVGSSYYGNYRRRVVILER